MNLYQSSPPTPNLFRGVNPFLRMIVPAHSPPHSYPAHSFPQTLVSSPPQGISSLTEIVDPVVRDFAKQQLADESYLGKFVAWARTQGVGSKQSQQKLQKRHYESEIKPALTGGSAMAALNEKLQADKQLMQQRQINLMAGGAAASPENRKLRSLGEIIVSLTVDKSRKQPLALDPRTKGLYQFLGLNSAEPLASGVR